MFDRDYFETDSKRFAPPYTLENVYPRMLNIAKYFKCKYNPEKVLDLGCAKGFLVKAFMEFNVNAVGIDVSSYALLNSTPDIQNRLLLASAEKIPFRDKSFDFLFAIDLIEHLKEPEKFLFEANRVLIEKGKLCIYTIGPKNPNASKDITHVAVHPIKYWYKLFKECGFNPTRIYYQVDYPQIQNAPYTLSKKFKIQKFAQLWAIIKLTQLWTIIKLSFRMLCEQEYIFLLTKIKDVCA